MIIVSPLDVAIILDDSDASKHYFQMQKDLLKSFSQRITLSTSGIRLGIGISSSNTSTPVLLKDIYTHEKLAEKIDGFQYLGGSSRIDTALNEVTYNLFSPQNGGRTNAKKVVLLFTDGIQTSNRAEVYREAEKLRKLGGNVFIIVYGDVYDYDLLRKITGSEKKVLFVETSNAADSVNIVKKLLDFTRKVSGGFFSLLLFYC